MQGTPVHDSRTDSTVSKSKRRAHRVRSITRNDASTG